MPDYSARGAEIQAAIAALADPDPSDLATFQTSVWAAVVEAVTPRAAEISSSAAQSGVLAGTPVTWNLAAGKLVDEGDVTLSSNRITIAADTGMYKVQLEIAASFSANGLITFQMRDASNVAIDGITGQATQVLRLESNNTSDRSDHTTTALIVDTDGAAVVIDVDVIAVTNLSSILAGRRLIITEVG